MSSRRGRPRFPDQLTPAEWQVLEAVRHGLSNPHIARLRGVSTDAVKFHIANMLGKLGLRSRRELRQWAGVVRTSALFSRKGPSAMDASPSSHFQLGPVGQVARTVKDIEAATRWYSEVLGLKHLYTFGRLSFFDCEGLRLFLSEGDGGGESSSVLYFRVPEIHAACEALRLRGAELISAPHMIHRHADGVEEWMAFFNDNEGRPLGLMSSVAAPPVA